MPIDLSLDLASPSGGNGEEENGLSGWLQRSRERDAITARAEAEAKLRRLADEEDEEAEVWSQRLHNRSGRSKGKVSYGDGDLHGLGVRHALGAELDVGEEMILTLADESVVERDEFGRVIGVASETGGDLLENVRLAESNRNKKREQAKKRLRQPLYDAVDDAEFADGVVPGQKRALLSQYDEPTLDDRSVRMVLGDPSSASTALGAIQSTEANRSFQSLTTDVRLASSFLTKSEVEFSRRGSSGSKEKKRKHRSRKREETEDELGANGKTGEEDYDLGAILGDADGAAAEEAEAAAFEEKVSIQAVKEESEKPMHVEVKPEVPKKTTMGTIGRRVAVPRPVVNTFIVDDEEPDLAAALAQARAAALRQRDLVADRLAEAANAAPVPLSTDVGARLALELANHNAPTETVGDLDVDSVDTDGRRADGSLVFNSTTEFSTRLQASLSERAREQADAAIGTANGSATSVVQSTADVGELASDPVELGSWEGLDELEATVRAEEEAMEEENDHEDELDFMHTQPIVAKGMSATLELLRATGELSRANKLIGRSKDSREVDPSKLDSNIKLEYRDEHGRKLTQKEAFRQLSYKFHGQMPGKKAREKRIRQLEAEAALEKSRASILEGTAGTMRSLTKMQEATGKSHLVIKGGTTTSKNAVAGLAAELTKNKKH